MSVGGRINNTPVIWSGEERRGRGRSGYPLPWILSSGKQVHSKMHSAAAGPSIMQIRIQQLNFLLTGIFTTICNQVIFNKGGAEQSTLLLSFPSYLGMLLLVVLPEARVR